MYNPVNRDSNAANFAIGDKVNVYRLTGMWIVSTGTIVKSEICKEMEYGGPGRMVRSPSYGDIIYHVEVPETKSIGLDGVVKDYRGWKQIEKVQMGAYTLHGLEKVA